MMLYSVIIEPYKHNHAITNCRGCDESDMNRKERREVKIKFMMERIFACCCENGLRDISIRLLCAACDTTIASMYQYFEDMDDMVLKSTAYCMAKVEADFMALSPTSVADIRRFLDEVPYWTAREHGAKYRLMYQVYTTPKYLEHGKAFFKGVEQRYTEYAKELAPRLGIPWQVVQPLIFTFVRASVHYALFEDEDYLKPQLELIWQTCLMMSEKYTSAN